MAREGNPQGGVARAAALWHVPIVPSADDWVVPEQPPWEATSWTRTLRLGSQGPDVERLKRRLEQGWGQVRPRRTDGDVFDDDTRDTVLRFQDHYMNLVSDGIVGPRTRKALDASPPQPLIPVGPNPQPGPEPQPDPDPNNATPYQLEHEHQLRQRIHLYDLFLSYTEPRATALWNHLKHGQPLGDPQPRAPYPYDSEAPGQVGQMGNARETMDRIEQEIAWAKPRVEAMTFYVKNGTPIPDVKSLPIPEFPLATGQYESDRLEQEMDFWGANGTLAEEMTDALFAHERYGAPL